MEYDGKAPYHIRQSLPEMVANGATDEELWEAYRREVYPVILKRRAEYAAEYRRSRSKKFKAAFRAHAMVNHALRSGEMQRQPCEVCGHVKKNNPDSPVYAHHDDYAKPLDVRWLCGKHHAEWHKKNGPGANRE